MSVRQRLHNRRAHELVDLTFRGRPYVVGIGRFEDGRPAEVFVDAAKQSTDAADDARDGSLVLSLALQHNVPLDCIASAVTRGADGVPAGVIGAVVDILMNERGSMLAPVKELLK